jgi:hypothetical protein
MSNESSSSNLARAIFLEQYQHNTLFKGGRGRDESKNQSFIHN